jgi:hypothetical protein
MEVKGNGVVPFHITCLLWKWDIVCISFNSSHTHLYFICYLFIAFLFFIPLCYRTQDRDHWQVLLNMVLDLQVPDNAGNFLMLGSQEGLSSICLQLYTLSRFWISYICVFLYSECEEPVFSAKRWYTTEWFNSRSCCSRSTSFNSRKIFCKVTYCGM